MRRKQLNSAVEVAIFDSAVLVTSSRVETASSNVETVFASEGAGNAFGLGTVGASSDVIGGIGVCVVGAGVVGADVAGAGAVMAVEIGAVVCVLGHAAQKRAPDNATIRIKRFKLFCRLSGIVSEPPLAFPRV